MSRRSSPYDVSTARPAVAGYRGALSALTFAALLCAALLTPASPAAGAGGDSERTKIAEARHAFSMGALEEAVTLYEEALAEDPDDQRALWGLVKSYEATDRVESGVIPLLEDWLRRRPQDVSARM